MNILGFNPSHHGSVCLLQDGEIKYFIQEERLSRKKYDALPFISYLDLIKNYPIDYLTWSTPSLYYPSHNKSDQPYWALLYDSFCLINNKIKYADLSNTHHLSHAAHSFYNSGFKEAIGIVIDGLGSMIDNQDTNRETETIFYCSYPSNFKVLYKNVIKVNEQVNLSRAYETITMHLGWTRDEAGKTMGLAPYGKENTNFPKFFTSNIGNPEVFFYNEKTPSKYIKDTYPQTFINEKDNPQLKLSQSPKKWHHNESKITDLEKDLAWQIQNKTQQIVGNYVEKAIKQTGLKQICCSGGYFLNCVTNYYLKKRFPDVEFYFEPIANDSGTAIGAAKLLWYTETQDITIRPFKSLYLGKQYSNKKLLKGIKKYT